MVLRHHVSLHTASLVAYVRVLLPNTNYQGFVQTVLRIVQHVQVRLRAQLVHHLSQCNQANVSVQLTHTLQPLITLAQH